MLSDFNRIIFKKKAREILRQFIIRIGKLAAMFPTSSLYSRCTTGAASPLHVTVHVSVPATIELPIRETLRNRNCELSVRYPGLVQIRSGSARSDPNLGFLASDRVVYSRIHPLSHCVTLVFCHHSLVSGSESVPFVASGIRGRNCAAKSCR